MFIRERGGVSLRGVSIREREWRFLPGLGEGGSQGAAHSDSCRLESMLGDEVSMSMSDGTGAGSAQRDEVVVGVLGSEEEEILVVESWLGVVGVATMNVGVCSWCCSRGGEG